MVFFPPVIVFHLPLLHLLFLFLNSLFPVHFQLVIVLDSFHSFHLKRSFNFVSSLSSAAALAPGCGVLSGFSAWGGGRGQGTGMAPELAFRALSLNLLWQFSGLSQTDWPGLTSVHPDAGSLVGHM